MTLIESDITFQGLNHFDQYKTINLLLMETKKLNVKSKELLIATYGFSTLYANVPQSEAKM